MTTYLPEAEGAGGVLGDELGFIVKVLRVHPSFGVRDKYTGEVLVSSETAERLAHKWATLDEDSQEELEHRLASAVLLWLTRGEEAWFEVDMPDHDERATLLETMRAANIDVQRRRGAFEGPVVPALIPSLLTGTWSTLEVTAPGGRRFDVQDYLDTVEVVVDEAEVEGLLGELFEKGFID